jgi:hypothetical protein
LTATGQLSTRTIRVMRLPRAAARSASTYSSTNVAALAFGQGIDPGTRSPLDAPARGLALACG